MRGVKRLDVVICCTKRKQGISSAEEVRMRDLAPEVSAAELAARWLEKTAQAPRRLAAEALYAGAGWQAGLRAYAAAQALGEVRLWVASAGFGLVGIRDELPRYSASFCKGSEGPEDRVADRLEIPGSIGIRHQAWWAAVNSARSRGPAPVADLDGDLCLVAAGKDYLTALTSDLVRFVERRSAAELLLLSAGASQEALPLSLRPSLLPTGKNLQHLLRCPAASVNQWALHWLLEEIIPKSGWDRPALERALVQVCGREG